MKSVWAVCMAAARQTVWKLLTIVTAMAAVEIGLFYRLVRQRAPLLDDVIAFGETFTDWIQRTGMLYLFCGAFVLLTAVLLLQGCDYHGGRLGYTLRRLPIGEAAITLLWAAMHVICYAILWAVQVAVIWVCWQIFTRSGFGSGQLMDLFILFYLDDFLHGLLPLAHVVVWVRQFLWVLSMGLGTAWFGLWQRRGKTAIGPAFALVAGLVTFHSGLRGGDELADLTAALFGVMTVYYLGQIWRRAYETED